MPEWWVYLIECRDGSVYTGIATNVERRYAEHASGKGARYTRSHPPLRLLARFPHPDRASASRAEFVIKQLSPAQKRALVEPVPEDRLAPPDSHCDAGASLPVVPDVQEIEFELDRDHVELNQLLKLAGLCDSGGAGKALVASGAVAVDGTAESRKTCKVRAGQVVTLPGVAIRVVRSG